MARMDTAHRKGWRWRMSFLAGAAAPFLSVCLAHAQPGTAPPAAAKPLGVEAAAELPTLGLGDCLRIAFERQPALAAHRASLAAAESGRRALEKMNLAVVLARDLPIRKQQAALGVTIASAGLAQAEWENRYAVTRTYLSVLYAREQQRVAEDVVSNFRFYLERVSELVKKGETREW